jgi:1-acyl-sn-glycerol-3-phosphate acyltransferase
MFWRRSAFRRCPGTITIEFLPPMPRGLDRDGFLAELTMRIETATDRLCGSAGAIDPSPHANRATVPVEPGESL